MSIIAMPTSDPDGNDQSFSSRSPTSKPGLDPTGSRSAASSEIRTRSGSWSMPMISRSWEPRDSAKARSPCPEPRSSTRPRAGRTDAMRSYGVRIERSRRKLRVDSGASAKSELLLIQYSQRPHDLSEIRFTKRSHRLGANVSLRPQRQRHPGDGLIVRHLSDGDEVVLSQG